MPFLRQSTTQVIRFGPCLDKTDGVTEETALTLAQADMRLSKDGGAFAQKSAAGNATHDSDGWYDTTLSTTDTATVGELIFNAHQPANMLPVWVHYWVLEESIYDALFGASAAGFDSNQRVDLGAWLGTAPLALVSQRVNTSVGAMAAAVLTAAAIATDAITAAKIAADAGVEIAQAVWDRVLTGATHNITNSAGRRLRQIEAAFVVASGTAQAGGVATITLAAGESAVDDIFAGDRVVIVGGTGVGEHGIVTAYNGTTKVATMSQSWVTQPDATSEYDLVPADVDLETIEHSVAAIDNLLADYDGTGYTKANSTIGTTTVNTDMRGTDSALLAANVPTNFADLAITVTTGRVDLALWLGVAPNALISGRVDTDVAVVNTAAISTTSFSAGAVDAAALAANVITSSELADSATPRILKNTALANFMFLMVDSTDHVTPKTGLTFGAGDSQRSLNGAAFANTTNLPTEVGSGIYKVNLATTDLNADVVTFRFDGTAADSRLITILTQPV